MDEKEYEHRLTAVESRCKSNSHRLDTVEAELKENTELIVSIKELALETKHMREDLNETIQRLDRVLKNIDEEVARYIDNNNQLKVEYILEHLSQVEIYPDKVIVIVPILSEGIVVEKSQYVSREKRGRQEHDHQVHTQPRASGQWPCDHVRAGFLRQ